MTGNAAVDDDVAVGLAAHLWDDSPNDVDGSKEVSLELIPDQRSCPIGGCEFFDRSNHSLACAAEEDIDLFEGAHGFSNRRLALADHPVRND